MAYADDKEREERERISLEKLREEARLAEEAKMHEWADFCMTPPKVGALYLTLSHGAPTGDIFRITAVLEKPNPKKHGSGRYRMEFVGDASARELGEIPHLPIGVFETLGDPGDRIRK
jgi:hypothetical protein